MLHQTRLSNSTLMRLIPKIKNRRRYIWVRHSDGRPNGSLD